MVTLLYIDFVALALVLFFGFILHARRKHNGPPRPPGPRGLPIIGNLLDIPKNKSWLTYAEWAKTYGDIMSVEMFGQVIVILQSSNAARDLLETGGSLYSDRLTLPFFGISVDQYRSVIKKKAGIFVQRLLSQPESLTEHLEYFQGAIIMAAAYGFDFKNGDENIGESLRPRHGGDNAARCFVVKHLPAWFPGIAFEQLATLTYKLGRVAMNGPLDYTKEAMSNGIAQQSLALNARPVLW
ncbi:cytochrome P450 [Artomyces pyxidatus]|uniref:Cytochrome P450 n=1 Tax=Artomyces pyxidatus TaxID=48021 RepID=A0ACB8T0Q7_9AGAM|nr:cytochrome P450 [Artomyces pyxidatus]